jgi:hypothetical protein
MLKKYLTKFTVDILPSVAATVIGAYIVNHYIVTKPASNAPIAAAVSTVEPKADAKAKSPDSANVASIPEAGVKAKGISEKAVLEKAAPEKPAAVEKPVLEKSAVEKSPEKAADKPADTASIPAEPRRHQPAPREKSIAKIAPAPVPPSAPAAVPVVAAPNPAPPPVETSNAAAPGTPEDRRDANDLARAAIERLRGGNDGSPRPQETARVPDAPRAQEASRAPDAARSPDAPRVVLAPPVRPLPPPIMVSTPTRETLDSTGSSEMKPPYAATARTDDPRRPTPPAEIPSQPLDLRAEAAGPGSSPREHTTIAEDMLSTAKSVFHAVLPK